jgi:hypothetical protein
MCLWVDYYRNELLSFNFYTNFSCLLIFMICHDDGSLLSSYIAPILCVDSVWIRKVYHGMQISL